MKTYSVTVKFNVEADDEDHARNLADEVLVHADELVPSFSGYDASVTSIEEVD